MRAVHLRQCQRVLLALGLSVLALTGCKAQGEADDPLEDGASNEEGLTGAMPAGSTLRVLADLNLRDQPSTSGKVLLVMPAGATVTLQASEPKSGFYQIAYQGTLGWSSGKYLEPSSDGETGAVTTTLTTTGAVNLRSGPGTSYSVLTVVPMGAEVAAVEPDPVDGFYHVKYQDLTGYCSGKYLTAGGAASVPFSNGQVWKFRAKTLAVDVAVFVPEAAAQAPEVEVLFYVHGLNVCSPVAKNPPVSFVTEEPFHLGKLVDASKRPVVLAVPFMDWEHLAANGMATGGSNHKLGIPQNLNGVVAEVLEQVGKQRSTPTPGLTALFLAGHSRAYSFLNPLAAANGDPQMSSGALSKLTQVWGLDSGYACSPMSSWKSWMKSKPSLFVTQDYRAGTGTADCGQAFAGLVAASGGQLSVHAVPEGHCDVPATELPVLLDALP